MARASRNIIIHPRLLTARRSPQTKKMIRERIKYVVRGLDPLRAGSSFPGGALTKGKGLPPPAKLNLRGFGFSGGSLIPSPNGNLSAARPPAPAFNLPQFHFFPRTC